MKSYSGTQKTSNYVVGILFVETVIASVIKKIFKMSLSEKRLIICFSWPWRLLISQFQIVRYQIFCQFDWEPVSAMFMRCLSR